MCPNSWWKLVAEIELSCSRFVWLCVAAPEVDLDCGFWWDRDLHTDKKKDPNKLSLCSKIRSLPVITWDVWQSHDSTYTTSSFQWKKTSREFQYRRWIQHINVFTTKSRIFFYLWFSVEVENCLVSLASCFNQVEENV